MSPASHGRAGTAAILAPGDGAADSAAGGRRRRGYASNLPAFGEPMLWAHGGALALGILLIVALLAMVLWNGFTAFFPRPIALVTLADGTRLAGEPTRTETFRPEPAVLAALPAATRTAIAAAGGRATRTLYRTGNFDIYNQDFRWVADYDKVAVAHPPELVFVERLEWGVFVGRIAGITIDGRAVPTEALAPGDIDRLLAEARQRARQLREIERGGIGAVNHRMEEIRLAARRAALDFGPASAQAAAVLADGDARLFGLRARYEALAAQAQAVRAADDKVTITLAEIGGATRTMALSKVVRLYPANDLSLAGRLGIYLSRWAEFLADDPREANSEGGVWPALFGTVAMTVLMAALVTPFGVITALYLREYARQGRLVGLVRISVNNLAGVPSIVYGVFGLGFFAYILGGHIDQLFYPERLPNPTFGTGGLLWASLTLALLTVPVVIVATEEALAAVPRSVREGSLACGASKWQTIRHIVLPRAMPGILTSLILAMARGAGEVAPLMLVGVVKLAPELPIDGMFPFVHLERSFMHLGFHIYDVGFQSRNSEAGKPMVFVTTLVLIALIAVLNTTAIVIRNRLRRRFAVGHF